MPPPSGELLHLLCAQDWADEHQAMPALQRWLYGPFRVMWGCRSVLWRAFCGHAG